jgi:uncharacterized membrane protein (UPF0127 family)
MLGRGAGLVVVCTMALAACSGGGDTPTALPTQHRTLVVNEEPTPICLAVATTVAEQVAGLSQRPSLPPKEGMAFPFATAGPETFTMKDTAVPLVVVWVGPNGEVLSSTSMAPFDTAAKPSPGPITLAVELSPQDWGPLAGSARTISLGQVCEGTITVGRPGTKPSQF